MTEQAAGAPVNGHEILSKLASLPISTWNYIGEDPSVRHLGPMAQDFKAAFGLGDSDKLIDMSDANGVVMVAIQALHRRLAALTDQAADLEGRLAEAQARDGR
jgi:hypothetical protein